jgi:hypothetical protein
MLDAGLFFQFCDFYSRHMMKQLFSRHAHDDDDDDRGRLAAPEQRNAQSKRNKTHWL